MRAVVLAIVSMIALGLIGENLGGASALVLAQVLVYALYACATNLLLGYGGIVTFGQSAFFGIASYVVGLNFAHFGLSPWIAMVLAPVVSGVAALLVGWVFLRSRGLYFALLTLSFTMFVYTIVDMESYTGGHSGIVGITLPSLISGTKAIFIFVDIVTVVGLLALWRVIHSRFGVSLRAIRTQEARVDSLGISSNLVRVEAFGIAGVFCGIAGVLYVVLSTAAFPDSLYWVEAGYPVVMAVIGGMGTFLGPCIGAVIYWVGYTELSAYTQYWEIVLGALVVAIAVLLPEGVVGAVLSIGRRRSTAGGHNTLVSEWRERVRNNELVRNLRKRD